MPGPQPQRTSTEPRPGIRGVGGSRRHRRPMLVEALLCGVCAGLWALVFVGWALVREHRLSRLSGPQTTEAAREEESAPLDERSQLIGRSTSAAVVASVDEAEDAPLPGVRLVTSDSKPADRLSRGAPTVGIIEPPPPPSPGGSVHPKAGSSASQAAAPEAAQPEPDAPPGGTWPPPVTRPGEVRPRDQLLSYSCPLCDGPMTKRNARAGGFYWGCIDYPVRCRGTRQGRDPSQASPIAEIRARMAREQADRASWRANP